jgi:hypothetical protein
MRRNFGLTVLAVLSLLFGLNAQAQDEWKFGIGTGISLYDVDETAVGIGFLYTF